jgi:NAD(P)-dependent dehydrogenase (short-subunit alcohol dehydrogenase family)
MSPQELAGTTALVTGASRGFGRATATALAEAGAHVVGVARDRARLQELQGQLGDRFTPVAADATDPTVAGQLIDAHRPRTLVLCAGDSPLSRPLHHHTWQTFSRPWQVDVLQVFHWTRQALLVPLDPGSVVIAFSSGAALQGSPLSGGYTGAKAAGGRGSLLPGRAAGCTGWCPGSCCAWWSRCWTRGCCWSRYCGDHHDHTSVPAGRPET